MAAHLPHVELKLKNCFGFWPLAADVISGFGLSAASELLVVPALLPHEELKLKERFWFLPLAADSISGFELPVAALLPQEVLKLSERFFETPKVATAKMAEVKKIERNNFILDFSKLCTTPVYCLNFTGNYLNSNSAFMKYFIGYL